MTTDGPTADAAAGRPDPAGAPVLADPIDPAGPAGEPLTANRIARHCGELALAVLVAAAVSLPMQFVIARLHIPRPSYVWVAMTSLTSVALLLGAVWLVVRRGRSGEARFGGWSSLASWAGLSALNTAVLAFMLNGTKFYLGGISSDQSFRTAYFTRLTDSLSVKDFAFLGLPSYYPSGWFWLGGRFANLLGLAGWQAYKPFAILTIAVAGAITYTSWSLVTNRRAALLLAIAASTVGVATWAAYEPYAWVVGALVPPMAAVAWKYLTGLIGGRATGSQRWAPGVFLGVYIGVLALFYTLLFLFFVAVVVLTALIGLGLRWRATRESGGRGPIVRQAVLRVLLVGVVALPVMLIHWGPYLLQAVGATKQSAASAILPEFGGQFPVPIGLGDFVGLLSLLGLVWLVVRVRDGVVAKALVVVLAAGYLWYGVSMLGIPFKVTLLPYKIELVMDEAFRAAGVLALLDVARWAATRLRGKFARWQRTSLAAVTVLAVLGTVGILQSAGDDLSPLPDQAISDYYPTGYTSQGGHDTTQSGAWNANLHTTIATLSGKPDDQLVVLSDYQDFLSFWPYWNYETSIIEYANPLADFYDREAAVAQWAKASSPAQLTSELDHAKFTAPNVFVFTRKADGLHITVTRNVFPAYPQIASSQVVFDPKLFDSPEFTTQQVGPFTVVVRH